MKNRWVAQRLNRLDAVFNRCDSVITTGSGAPDPFEFQSDLGRYLCVLLYGFLEASIEDIFTAYARQRSSPQISRFVGARLRRLPNLNSRALLQIAEEFDPGAKDRVESFLDTERRDAIDTIYNNRNKIAHGDWVTITYGRVKGFRSKVVDVVERVELEFPPA